MGSQRFLPSAVGGFATCESVFVATGSSDKRMLSTNYGAAGFKETDPWRTNLINGVGQKSTDPCLPSLLPI